MSAYRPRRSRSAFSAVIIALVLLAALAIGFLLGNLLSSDDDGLGQGSPSSVASPSASGAAASAAPTASTSAAPSAAPLASGSASPVVTAPEGVIPPGGAVRVVADGLRMRGAPSTDAVLVETLPANQLLVVGHAPQRGDFGPVSGGGLDWYPVVRLGDLTELPPLSEGPLSTESAFGWVAGGDASEAYIELVAPRCAARPVDLATLEAMLPWERLACFGSESITVEGTFGCGGCGGLFPGTFEPIWIAHPNNFNLLSVDASARLGPFSIRLAPDGPEEPDQASILRVTGHFDDGAAAGCTIAPGEPPVPIDPAVAVLFCREQFVADSFEVTGTDADFPFS